MGQFDRAKTNVVITDIYEIFKVHKVDPGNIATILTNMLASTMYLHVSDDRREEAIEGMASLMRSLMEELDNRKEDIEEMLKQENDDEQPDA